MASLAILPRVCGFDIAVEAVTAGVAGCATEQVALAFCDRAGRVIQLRQRSEGLADMVAVPVREIAIDALLLDAGAVVMAHNHPSGEAWPSRADRDATRRIAVALNALGVRLHDHVIVAGDARWSFRGAGLL